MNGDEFWTQKNSEAEPKKEKKEDEAKNNKNEPMNLNEVRWK